MNAVEKWYADGQDFDEGYSLLFLHKPSFALPLQEWVGRNFIPPQYRQELRRYLDALPSISIVSKSIVTSIVSETVINTATNTLQTEPPIILEYRRKWYENTNTYRRTHALMAATDDDFQRGKYATEIMTQIIPERTHISTVLEDWQTKQKLPVSSDAPTSDSFDYAQGLRDGAAQHQQIHNLTSRLNKIENKLLPEAKKAKDTERIALLEKEQQEKEAKRDAIKQKLGLTTITPDTA